MPLLTEFNVLVATARLVGIEDAESVHGALWQNSHGINKLLGTAKVSAHCTTTGSQNSHQGAAAGLLKGAGGGRRGAGQRLLGQWSGTAPSISKSKTTEVQRVQHILYTATTTKEKGIGDVQTYCVPTPLEPP